MLGVDNATSEVVHHFLRSLTVKVSRTTVCRLLDSPLGQHDARYQRCLKRTSCK